MSGCRCAKSLVGKEINLFFLATNKIFFLFCCNFFARFCYIITALKLFCVANGAKISEMEEVEDAAAMEDVAAALAASAAGAGLAAVAKKIMSKSGFVTLAFIHFVTVRCVFV